MLPKKSVNYTVNSKGYCCCFWVPGLVSGFQVRFWALGSRFYGFKCQVPGFTLLVSGFGYRVLGSLHGELWVWEFSISLSCSVSHVISTYIRGRGDTNWYHIKWFSTIDTGWKWGVKLGTVGLGFVVGFSRDEVRVGGSWGPRLACEGLGTGWSVCC